MSRRSGALVLALTMAFGGLAAPPAGAHGGDLLARPIVERIRPDAEGLSAQVVFTANFQMIFENKSDTEVSIMAPTGEAFLRIGPQGVFFNHNSPAWFDSNSPDGLQRFPDWAKPGPEVAPEWRRVSREPSWGWYDHRLHPVERYIDPKIKARGKTARVGDWAIPIRHGDKDGKIEGYFEFKPAKGGWKTVLKSSDTPADGVKVGIVQSNVLPALYLENNSPKTVLVLGKEDEPFVRLGPKAEVNVTSPTYVEIAQARGESPDLPADAKGSPTWKEVGSKPRWGWLEVRARPPADPPKKALERTDRPTDVKKWSIPLLIGDERTELEGVTQFVPIAVLQKRPADKKGSNLPMYIAVVLTSAGVAFVVLRPKKKGKPAAPAPRRRSRSAPKVKR